MRATPFSSITSMKTVSPSSGCRKVCTMKVSVLPVRDWTNFTVDALVEKLTSNKPPYTRSNLLSGCISLVIRVLSCISIISSTFFKVTKSPVFMQVCVM